MTHPTLPLVGGGAIPVLGLGVYESPPGEVTERAVLHALAAGYRHIDTARIYGNESDVGRAIKKSGVSRDDIFVTTKLWNADHGYDAALRACAASLKSLGVSYVDLYLIHWPVARLRKETWRAMKALRESGMARAIGVSNYTVRHLDEFVSSSDVLPAVNQIELHPFLQARDIVAFCRNHGIVVEAYSPLTRGQKLRDPRIVAIANAVGKTEAQILVRWGIDHGFVSLPKSVQPQRIDENAAVFDFTLRDEDRKTLDGLEEGLHTCWDPSDAI